MGYSRGDWLRDQGIRPGIDLDRIRFGHRVERRETLNVVPLSETLTQNCSKNTGNNRSRVMPGIAFTAGL